MTIYQRQKKEIERLISTFNANIEWLRKNQPRQFAPFEKFPEWVGVDDALKILGRGRSWLKSRMIEDYDSASKPLNTDRFLIRGVDYERENGKILTFRTASVQRLKAEMRKMGAAESIPED